MAAPFVERVVKRRVSLPGEGKEESRSFKSFLFSTHRAFGADISTYARLPSFASFYTQLFLRVHSYELTVH